MVLPEYSKIYALGKPETYELLGERVTFEEKIDGSQLTFGKRDGKLFFRSKRAIVNPINPPDLFGPTIAHLLTRQDDIVEGWTYRGEAMKSNKHNTLTYSRVPAGNLVLFDIEAPNGDRLPRGSLLEAAGNLEVEAVRVFGGSNSFDTDDIASMKEAPSQLGGVPVEGVVIKPLDKPIYCPRTGKVLMAKWVSEKFKERHQKASRGERQDGAVEVAIERYRTEARWRKAVQHLEEEGKLLLEPRDIGPLIKEIHRDLYEEEAAEIEEMLQAAADKARHQALRKMRKQVFNGVSSGFPEWYKQHLIDRMSNDNSV